MVKVLISNHNEMIHNVVISGHADSVTTGLDLVCAQVSAISVGILNAVDEICVDSCGITMKSGYVEINVIQNSEFLQVLLKTLVIQLETVAFTNNKYIKITKVEV